MLALTLHGLKSTVIAAVLRIYFFQSVGNQIRLGLTDTTCKPLLPPPLFLGEHADG